MLPATYNSNFEIIQTPGYVTITNEMIHETRVIPLNGPAHYPQMFASGWETHVAAGRARTLVIETRTSPIRRRRSGPAQTCIWSSASRAKGGTR